MQLLEPEQALLEVIAWRRRFRSARALLTVVCVVFLWAAATLLLAPGAQLFTEGTQPAFTLFPPPVWAVLFAAGGIACGWLLARFTLPRMFTAGVLVLPVQVMWLAASALAVTRGAGSPLGVVFFGGLVLFTLVTAAVVAVDFTSGKR